jgi:hypothetical protein
MATTGATKTYKQNIAIVALTVEDYWNFIKRELKKFRRITNKRVETANTTYWCVSKPDHAIGINLTDVMITENAHENPTIGKIVETIKPSFSQNLSKEKTLMIQAKLDSLMKSEGFGMATLVSKPIKPVFVLKSNSGFLQRLWFIITNPFIYLLTGKMRY